MKIYLQKLKIQSFTTSNQLMIKGGSSFENTNCGGCEGGSIYICPSENGKVQCIE